MLLILLILLLLLLLLFLLLYAQGASNPLVVKYADTERERHARKMQKAMQQFAELSLNPVFQVLPHPQFFNPIMYAQVSSIDNSTCT